MSATVLLGQDVVVQLTNNASTGSRI